MDLSDDDLERFAAVDRREVDLPIPVQAATWSIAGQLDWWVKERQEWFGRVRGRMAVNGGSELLIFVPRAAHSHDLTRLSRHGKPVSRTGPVWSA